MLIAAMTEKVHTSNGQKVSMNVAYLSICSPSSSLMVAIDVFIYRVRF